MREGIGKGEWRIMMRKRFGNGKGRNMMKEG